MTGASATLRGVAQTLTARRTQAQRREATRGAIAEATLDSLARHGYEATTIATVAAAAGVSRGAALHYFPRKVDLVTSVLEEALARHFAWLEDEAQRLPRGQKRTAAALDLIYAAFLGRFFQASMAAQIASRADAQLWAGLHPVFERVYAGLEELAPRLFGPEVAGARDLGPSCRMIIATVRGLAVFDPADEDAPHDRAAWLFARRRLAALIDDLKRN
jgi:AcrR family transcriptional regulator